MNSINTHRMFVYIMLGSLIFMNINYQKNILTSIKILSLQCKATYNITIPDGDDYVEDWSLSK